MCQRAFAPSASVLRFLRASTENFKPSCGPPFRITTSAQANIRSTSASRSFCRSVPQQSTLPLRYSRPWSVGPSRLRHNTFTTTSCTRFWGLWGKHGDGQSRLGDRRSGAGLNDLPPLPTLLEESGGLGILGLGRTTRPTHEMKLRCTEFNEHGDVTLTNGEFKKTELIAKVRMFIWMLLTDREGLKCHN